MSNFVEELASKAGLDSDQAHEGIDKLLGHLKDRLDPATFAHLKNAIPHSDNQPSDVEAGTPSSSGGTLDTLKGLAGKMFGAAGGQTSTNVDTESGNSDLSSEHMQTLLPKLHEMLAGKLPPRVMEQIQKHVPGFESTTEDSDSGAAGDSQTSEES